MMKPKGNVINYEDAVNAFEEEEWTDEAVYNGEIDPCFKGEICQKD